jgi:hypothetical protein
MDLDIASGNAVFYSSAMSTATAHLLSEFDRLSPEEQREFSAILLRRTAQIDYGDITDEELTASAARVFEMLDAEEDAKAG